MSNKRKHTTLTIETKHEIIKLLDRGERVNALAARYGVGRATVYDIQRNRDRIEEFVAGRRAEAGRRQTLKRGEFPGVEEALYAWYVQRRRRDDGPVSGAALARRALSVHRHLQQAEGGGGGGGAPFKASVGWLNKFKKRYGILSGFPHADCDDDDDDDRPPPLSGDDEDVLVGRWSRASSSDKDRGPPPAVEIYCDDDDDDGDDDDERRTAAETSGRRTAVDSFDECVAWAEENGVPARDLRVLRKLRHRASEQLRRPRVRRQLQRSADRNNV